MAKSDAGAGDVEAILKRDPPPFSLSPHPSLSLTHTHTHAQLLGTMTENDGYSCRGGPSEVQRWKKGEFLSQPSCSDVLNEQDPPGGRAGG